MPSLNPTLALPAASRKPKHSLLENFPNNHGEEDHSNNSIKKKRLFSLELCLSLTISTRVNKKPPQELCQRVDHAQWRDPTPNVNFQTTAQVFRELYVRSVCLLVSKYPRGRQLDPWQPDGISWTYYHFAIDEITGDSDRGRGADVLQYIRLELADMDLHAALQRLYRSFQGPNTEHTRVEGQLINRLFHRLRCVLFLHSVLSSDSISAGMKNPDAVIIAKKIIYFCGKQVIRRGGPIEDYFLLSWHNFSYLMLGGIGLQSNHCSPESMKPCG